MDLTLTEIVLFGAAAIVLIAGAIGDYRASKKENQPQYPRPEPWDKSYED